MTCIGTNEEFLKMLSEHRRNKGMSIEDAARIGGVSTDFVIDVEAGLHENLTSYDVLEYARKIGAEDLGMYDWSVRVTSLIEGLLGFMPSSDNNRTAEAWREDFRKISERAGGPYIADSIIVTVKMGDSALQLECGSPYATAAHKRRILENRMSSIDPTWLTSCVKERTGLDEHLWETWDSELVDGVDRNTHNAMKLFCIPESQVTKELKEFCKLMSVCNHYGINIDEMLS